MHGLAQSKTIVRVSLLALAAVAAALALGAVLAESAAAQLPPICEQYPQLPQCQPPVTPGDGGNGNGAGGPDARNPSGPGDEVVGVPTPFVVPGVGVPTAGPGAGAAGALPFTGYPLTPLLLLLLILLTAGLLIRAYLAARERWRPRDDGASSGTA